MPRWNRTQVLLLVLIAALTATTVTLWILPVAGAPRGGIACDSMEGGVVHFHVRLQLYREGVPLALPADLGRTEGCDYWLHTHTPDGIVHVESPVVRTFTLGEVFTVWGQNPLAGASSVHLWVKGEGEAAFHEETGPWADLVLKPHQVLALGTGAFTPLDFSFPKGL